MEDENLLGSEDELSAGALAFGIAVFAGFTFAVAEASNRVFDDVFATTTMSIRGAEVVAVGVAQVGGGLVAAYRWLGGARCIYPEGWLAVTWAFALFVALRRRSLSRAQRRAPLVVATAVVALGVTGTLLAIRSTPRDGEWTASVLVWIVCVGALTAMPWLDRRRRVVDLARWRDRPNAPRDPLPEMPELPRALRELARGARVVRASLQGWSGLDGDARRLIWDFLHRLDACGEAERAVLEQLGLRSEPLHELLHTARANDIGPLLALDAALARIESELSAYRSRVFR